MKTAEEETTAEVGLQRVPLSPWEVGGELLDILSRGLYSDAKDALREYVQNGVDAHADEVQITVDGGEVSIRDDGDGMDEESIRAVRRFGLSFKSPTESVGYRGIGVYSAFGICDEMTITSRTQGMAIQTGWVFEFKGMRDVLESDKAGGGEVGYFAGRSAVSAYWAILARLRRGARGWGIYPRHTQRSRG